MPDGSPTFPDVHDAPILLSACNRPGARLHARCPAPGCGAEGDIDPAHWLRQGLGWAPVRAFETRLRCVCGARRARLELREAEPGARIAPGPIHVFR